MRRPPRSTQSRSSAASDVYKRQTYFLVAYALSAYFFSAKMMRLVLLAGPVASALSGVVISTFIQFAIDSMWGKKTKRATARKGNSIEEMYCALKNVVVSICCLLYTSPSPRDRTRSRMPSSA
eukprot:TRINITY_DN29294_c0_g1_i1.p1 TRINITY_DN29294_c0_g1~~TRINITY_DN29294_c0_g1_i1.p1  ORF type:complete len:123 (+),score=66.54 TRINITY_DN29294_c0_g1_i1:84-452(+)